VAMTRRGRMAVTISAVLTLLVAVVVGFVLSGSKNPVTSAINRLTGNSTTPPAPCPLTGLAPRGGKAVPQRPVLAIKVENTSEAYPLAGLDRADVVYEELVEGGITRFMAVYQCSDSTRVGPVRSARTTDPGLLVQYGAHPLLAYSGGQRAVVDLVNKSGTIGLTETSAAGALRRDTARVAPHNLFGNTRSLYAAAKRSSKNEGAPDPLFTFGTQMQRGKTVRGAQIGFSSGSTAAWSWSGGRWVRLHDGAPMKLDDGAPIEADNVLIQQVVVAPGKLVDVLGNPSPDVTLTGSGKAWLLRDGKVVTGRWQRDTLDDPTVIRTRAGDTFVLKPGQTWVELAPKGMPVTFSKR
jgi:hypothetical protein